MTDIIPIIREDGYSGEVLYYICDAHRHGLLQPVRFWNPDCQCYVSIHDDRSHQHNACFVRNAMIVPCVMQ